MKIEEIPSVAPEPMQARRTLQRDILVALAMTLAVAALAAHLELQERVYRFTRNWESLQLDEWPIAVFVLMLCFVWMTWRRYKLALEQLRARRVAEARLADALAENRRLAQENLRVQENERKLLAHELHDELSQYTNAIKIDAIALETRSRAHAELAPISARIGTAVEHMHEVLRGLIGRLRPAGLDELGLVAALESCIDHWRSRLPSTLLSLRTEGTFDDLGEATTLTLYRIVQEALTNASRHSGADRIDVLLMRDLDRESGTDDVTLVVADDGRGMDSTQPTSGFGLSGIRERVALNGGTFEMETTPNSGLRLQVRIPVTTR